MEGTGSSFDHLCSVSLLHLSFESGEISTKLSGLKLSKKVFGECGSFFSYSFDLNY